MLISGINAITITITFSIRAFGSVLEKQLFNGASSLELASLDRIESPTGGTLVNNFIWS